MTASLQKQRETFMRTTIYRTPPLVPPLYFWQTLTSECVRSPGCDCPHPVNVYLRQTVMYVNRIDYLQADYVLRCLPETSQFCDV